MKRIVLVGPQGCGKSTLRAHLAQLIETPSICSGELVRDEMRRGTSFGLRVRAAMDSGQLLTDEDVEQLVLEKIAEAQQTGWILDGYPRRPSQADTLLNRFGCDAVVHLQLSDADCLDRLTKRRVCPVCGLSYHLIARPPKVHGACDRCGTPLAQRDDDQPAAIQARLEAYHRETEPMLPTFHQGNVPVVAINAGNSIEDVLRHTLWRLGQAIK